MSFEVTEWEEVDCPLCTGRAHTSEPIMLHGVPLTDGQFGYAVHPVICSCGLIYLNPRWATAAYDEFYAKYYDALYRLELKPDYGVQGVVNHMKRVWERTRAQYKKNKEIRRIIDIGCGFGYGLEYLKGQNPGAEIYGIEASLEGCRRLRDEIKAVVVDSDVRGDWVVRYENFFDFMVLRHVVEHFLSPVDTLRHVAKALSADGSMYIAVPDMMNLMTQLRDYDKWWEYYFRAVHPYYFNRSTLFKTLELAGLYPYAYGEGENHEVWCLVSKQKRAVEIEHDCYNQQVALLKKYLL